METVVYRKRQGVSGTPGTANGDLAGVMDKTEVPASIQEAGALHPAMFYPPGLPQARQRAAASHGKAR